MKVRLVLCHLRHPTTQLSAGVSPAQLVEITNLDPLSATSHIIEELRPLLENQQLKLDAGVILFRVKLLPDALGTLKPSALQAIANLLHERPGAPAYQVVAGQVVKSKERPGAFDVFHLPAKSHFRWECAIPFSVFRHGSGHGPEWARTHAHKLSKDADK